MPRAIGKITKSRKGIGGRGKKKVVNSNNATESAETPQPRPNLPETCKPYKVSSSSKKIDFSEYDKYDIDNSYKNELIDLSILSDILLQNTICKNCKQYGLQIRSENCVGLASTLILHCLHCDFVVKFSNTKEVKVPDVNKTYCDVNIRLVYGLRCIGKGLLAGQALCGILNLPQPPTKFSPYITILHNKCKIAAFDSMKNAVEEAVQENEVMIEEEKRNVPDVILEPRDISAGFDGTWQRRGHQSLNGVVTCTSIDSGKVMDVAVVSKYCICVDKQNHDAYCYANHKGSSGSMEGAGIRQIFLRSEEKYKVRYVSYLGDGDSSSFESIVALKPYGNTEIKKLECINHVSKRMGARLRRLKQDLKKQKLDDGKSLGGKNRLTDKKIDQIQSYYGKAIRENKTVQDMRQAIWAIYCHTGSSDEKPEHRLCPQGEKSWCKYNKAKAEGKMYEHKNNLPEPIMQAIKPIFKALIDPNLLKKCTHGKTQNVNESVNSVIWTRIPKNNFVTLQTLEFGVFEAVASYNDGNITKCRVLKSLGLEPSYNTIRAMKFLDSERIRRADQAISGFLRQSRRLEKLRKRKLEEDEEAATSYDAGMF
ncbi:uncharacterized protein LOC124367720 [Homalodisca vitripennis]|uniref:uncharacterized protein LOC124367720 n=1 Tax=Homalodisca vitripennis TaxID=197043 RepID=UPI001EEC540A|nr:uncharacterized protein LOC124367720 [Homalodisca vitripennis]